MFGFGRRPQKTKKVSKGNKEEAVQEGQGVVTLYTQEENETPKMLIEGQETSVVVGPQPSESPKQTRGRLPGLGGFRNSKKGGSGKKLGFSEDRRLQKMASQRMSIAESSQSLLIGQQSVLVQQQIDGMMAGPGQPGTLQLFDPAKDINKQFNFQATIGKGAYGSVILVKSALEKFGSEIFAIKILKQHDKYGSKAEREEHVRNLTQEL